MLFEILVPIQWNYFLQLHLVPSSTSMKKENYCFIFFIFSILSKIQFFIF